MITIATAFWRRLDLPGKDAARVCKTEEGYEFAGQCVFLDPRGPAALRYVLELEHNWSTRSGRIEGFIGGSSLDVRIARTAGGWTCNERSFGMRELDDLDLGFTPATNMAQLKRISLAIGGAADFDVVWLDAGSDELIRLPQNYRRMTEFEYTYTSPDSGYSATIALAQNGFAAVYPGLWEMAG